jgi:hypothetical protein
MDALLRVHNLLAGMPLEERRVDKRVALAFVVADMTRARRPLPSVDRPDCPDEHQAALALLLAGAGEGGQHDDRPGAPSRSGRESRRGI